MELNHRCFPSIEAASLRGRGITETLIAILKRTMSAAQRKAGGTALAEAELEHTVTTAIQWLSQSAQEASIARFGTTIETQSAAWPSVRETSRLDYDVEPTDPPFGMLEALERATSSLNDQDLTGLPHGLMAGLLAGCNRTRGSLLLFRRGTRRLDACEVVPAGSDPLNSPQPATGETTAAVLCSGREPVFLAEPTGTERLQGAWVVPVVFGSLTFGGMIVYVTESEQATTAAERAYWKTAAALAGVYLAWQAAGDRANGSRRARVAPGPEPIERLDV
jgi:GAF domain-containing protein